MNQIIKTEIEPTEKESTFHTTTMDARTLFTRWFPHNIRCPQCPLQAVQLRACAYADGLQTWNWEPAKTWKISRRANEVNF